MYPIRDLMEVLPVTVRQDIISFEDCRLRDGRGAIRVTLDRALTDGEKSEMTSKRLVGLNCLCQYRFAPEIRHSYFYWAVTSAPKTKTKT